MEVRDGQTDNFSDLEERFTDQEIEILVNAIRGENGVEIKDRRYRLTIYHDCFIGQELVSWLEENYSYKKEEAIELGQILMEKKIIHHVTDEHSFMDEYLFYSFI